ncbi:hypothetical protein L596_015723 [Steinernema carpocapsae]|uniref:Uncharacterized protein n=1 Tax=Steinernema carpocapsae TaxID=34508 RepID=A0A4U5NFZ7_STECR|nr:hypothetical protein L596_015723 [Steinernema carpocapsae]
MCSICENVTSDIVVSAAAEDAVVFHRKFESLRSRGTDDRMLAALVVVKPGLEHGHRLRNVVGKALNLEAQFLRQIGSPHLIDNGQKKLAVAFQVIGPPHPHGGGGGGADGQQHFGAAGAGGIGKRKASDKAKRAKKAAKTGRQNMVEDLNSGFEGRLLYAVGRGCDNL